MRNPFLIGEKIYLRPIEEADAERCYPWFSDPEVRRHIGRSAYPNTARDSRAFIAGVDGRARQMFAIVTRDPAGGEGEHVGNCELFAIDPVHRNAEVGIVIGLADHRGRGVGREALRLLCAHAFRALGLHQVHLRVFEPNERGRRCYAAAGFREDGRLREAAFIDGRFVDVLLMSRLAREEPPG